MSAHIELGRVGEDAATVLYRRRGFQIVERNWRCAEGELDLVARRGSLLVFCEVKTRSSESFGLPAEAVGFHKRRRLRRLAGRWVSEHRTHASAVRFDVVSVIVREGRTFVTHIPDAF
jgi:putative endonuclease